MNTTEIVIHEIKCNGVEMVFDLLAEGIGKTSKAPHAHSHRKVLTFPMSEFFLHRDKENCEK